MSTQTQPSRGRTIIAVSQVLSREADAGGSGGALRGAAAPLLLVLKQAGGGEPPGLGQVAARPGALQELAPLQGNAVVRRPEVRRPGPGAPGSARDSVGEAQIPQGQTLVAWRGGRGSSVTLILGGGGDTVHWMQAGVKGKGGMEMEGGGE